MVVHSCPYHMFWECRITKASNPRYRDLQPNHKFDHMEDDLLKHLYDIKAAAAAILRFVCGKTFDDYEEDELLRSGVERKFKIVGEERKRVRGEIRCQGPR